MQLAMQLATVQLAILQLAKVKTIIVPQRKNIFPEKKNFFMEDLRPGSKNKDSILELLSQSIGTAHWSQPIEYDPLIPLLEK